MNEQAKESGSAARAGGEKRHWSLWGGTLVTGVVVCAGFAWSNSVRARPASNAAASQLVVSPRSAAAARAAGELSPLEQIGQLLFEDPELSTPPGRACSSCHDPKRAFSGNAGSNIAAVAQGSRAGVFGTRNVPSISYAMFRPPFGFGREADGDFSGRDEASGGLFWDGRADTFQAQADGPLLNPREMNNADPASVVAKVRKASYAPLFLDVFGSNALSNEQSAYRNVGDALAAFQTTASFHRFSSKFDDYLRQGGELSREEARGFELFRDPEKGNCIACHAAKADSREPGDWLFTDFAFETLGLPRNRELPDNADPNAFDLGLCQRAGLAEKLPPHFDIRTLCGAFQVPSLRNVALTAPYGHNGVFATLREVVSFYATRDTQPERWYPKVAGKLQPFDDLPPQARANVNREVPYDRKLGQTPRLDEAEIDAVVAFLETLTDR